MAKKFLVPLSVNGLASDPASGSEGDLYFNTVSKSLKIYKNGAWEEVGGAGNESASIIAYINEQIDDTYDLIFEGQYTDDIEEGVSNLYFTNQRALDAVGMPSQTGNSGKYLTTNGASTSWGVVDALPSQTGNSGKYLTTNGANPAWAVLDLAAGIQTASAAATASAFTYTDQQIALVQNDPTNISFVRWNKVISASTSTISGLDDNSETLDYTPGIEQVFINGAFIPREDYTSTTGSSIVFDEPLYSTDIVEVLCLKTVAAVTEEQLATSVDRWTKLMTASTATISGLDDYSNTLDYSIGYTTVYVNGVLIDPSEYTATSGSAVVFDTAVNIDDVVEVLSYRSVGYIWDFYSLLNSASVAATASANTYTNSASSSIISYVDSEISALDIFSTIVTNPSTQSIVGDSNSDSLTFISGENISITAASASDSITINSTGNYTNVDSISTPDFIQFDTTANVSPVTGLLGWDSVEGTLNLGLSSGKHIHLGEESVFRVRNSTGSTIGKGTALYASGVEPSGRIQVTPYVADGSVREVRFMGLATESISSGVNGFVQHFGYVRDLDTRGTSSTSISVGDETWAAGDLLYVHPTVPGKLTNVKPQHEIVVAIIIIRHQSTGILFVRPTSGGHLEDIHDISLSSLSNEDILIYNSASSIWVNSPKQDIINTASAAAVSYLVDGAPAALDTLNELAEALNDNADILDLYLTQSSASVLYEPEIPYVSASPSGPNAGTLWIDSTNAAAPSLKVYNGTTWIAVSGASEAGLHPFFTAGI
jgi:hypothetical protein